MLSMLSEQINVDIQEREMVTVLYHNTYVTSLPVNAVILGHVEDSGDVVSRCSCPGAVQSACHDAVKVALFCAATVA